MNLRKEQIIHTPFRKMGKDRAEWLEWRVLHGKKYSAVVRRKAKLYVPWLGSDLFNEYIKLGFI